jgi:hypothetical protein
MTREIAAAYLCVSTDRLDDMRRDGLIAYIPNTKLFDRKKLDATLDELSGLRNASAPKLQPAGSRHG